jgi:type IV pilus assembly protein PilP
MARFAFQMLLLLALLASPYAVASRHPEPLEAFDLASLRYVAREVSRTDVVAIVKDPTGVSHRVFIGNYLGRNNGRVTVIKQTEVLVIELYPTGSGTWLERPTGLPYTPGL